MIFFDLDNTLLDHDGAEQDAIRTFVSRYIDEVSDEARQSPETVWRAITDRQRIRWRAGELSFQELRRARISELFKSPLSSEQADRLVSEYYQIYRLHWRLFPDVVPALTQLQQVSPLAVITNGFAFQQQAKLQDTNISEFFRFVVTSEQVGVAKPDPIIFQQAVKSAKAHAGDCWFVGNHPINDAEAAQQAGLKAVWLNRHRFDTKVSTRVVRTLDGFVDLVKVQY
ncbi:HAD family hydrolase [Photobacterium sanctipauli]|uniref:HAD family hydrolase n=2 Tax=Photobacterium sanctipauli TaxID=1342794 RepID=A0A2T3NTS1_9GAMM|nr:HAD family hydrolase [Photobacterium sanctipauli]PSW19647.1 HAD family hydrolase [Photobacterium sanctipauli]